MSRTLTQLDARRRPSGLWESCRRRHRRWHQRQPGYFADIKQKYGTVETFTVTNLQSLASSSTFLSGWTSAWIDNTSNLNLNSAVFGVIASGTTPTAGSVRVYAYPAGGSDGLSAPSIFSSGTPGTEGAATVTDSEMLDSFMVQLWSSSIDTTTNDNYPMSHRSIRQAFGFLPRKWALYVAHDTVAALKSSGSAFYVDHELLQS